MLARPPESGDNQGDVPTRGGIDTAFDEVDDMGEEPCRVGPARKDGGQHIPFECVRQSRSTLRDIGDAVIRRSAEQDGREGQRSCARRCRLKGEIGMMAG